MLKLSTVMILISLSGLMYSQLYPNAREGLQECSVWGICTFGALLVWLIVEKNKKRKPRDTSWAEGAELTEDEIEDLKQKFQKYHKDKGESDMFHSNE